MSEPDKYTLCPECKAAQWRLRDQQAFHTGKCSRATFDDLRVLLAEECADSARYRKQSFHWRMETDRWEAKYRKVKHENNQLRRKLYPANGKETDRSQGAFLQAFKIRVYDYLRELSPKELQDLFESVDTPYKSLLGALADPEDQDPQTTAETSQDAK